MVFLEEFFDKVDFEQNQQTTKKHKNYPAGRVKLNQCTFFFCISTTGLYHFFFVAGYFFMLLSSADFFSINFFKKFFKEHTQSVKQLDPVLISVQTVCRGYQQTTKVAASMEVKTGACHLIFACWVIFFFFHKL